MTGQVTVVWGLNGLEYVALSRPVSVVVDVLSFSTAVAAGCSQGAQIFPFGWKDKRAKAFAQSNNADLAVQRQDQKANDGMELPSLSPVSLTHLNNTDRLVLPSPNGSALSVQSAATTTIAGCLRNATAVAGYLNRLDEDVAIIAAGERWPDGSLRVALEDLIGAGAIVAELKLEKDVEALAAQNIFSSLSDDLVGHIRSTASGKELIELGYEDDVVFAAELNACNTVPLLIDQSYRDVS